MRDQMINKIQETLEYTRRVNFNQNILQGAKYLWILPLDEMALVNQIASDCNLTLSVAQILVGRGFKTKQSVENFLFCTYEKSVAHTSLMKDATKAVDRIMLAIV